jgi:hypothetical protein
MVSISTLTQWTEVLAYVSLVVFAITAFLAVAQLLRSPKPGHFCVTHQRFYGYNWFGRLIPLLCVFMGLNIVLDGLLQSSVVKLLLGGVGTLFCMLFFWVGFSMRCSFDQNGLHTHIGWPLSTRARVSVPWKNLQQLRFEGLGPFHVCWVLGQPIQPQVTTNGFYFLGFAWDRYHELLQLIIDHAPPTMTVDENLVAALPQLDLSTAGQHFQGPCEGGSA